MEEELCILIMLKLSRPFQTAAICGTTFKLVDTVMEVKRDGAQSTVIPVAATTFAHFATSLF